MRKALFIFFLFISMNSFSQHDYMLWTEIGVEKKIIKRLKGTLDFNTRFDRTGVATFFPQVGLDYKITKWLRGSVQYRFIVDKNKYGNYKSSNRLNFNLSFKENKKRFYYALRLRYQYAFNRISADAYDADFDQAIRLKPSFEYDLKNSIFTPLISGEFFYNPSYGPKSPGFSKVRIAVGSKLEMDGPHSVSFKYQLDKKFRDYDADLRHVLSLAYTYKL